MFPLRSMCRLPSPSHSHHLHTKATGTEGAHRDAAGRAVSRLQPLSVKVFYVFLQIFSGVQLGAGGRRCRSTWTDWTKRCGSQSTGRRSSSMRGCTRWVRAATRRMCPWWAPARSTALCSTRTRWPRPPSRSAPTSSRGSPSGTRHWRRTHPDDWGE